MHDPRHPSWCRRTWQRQTHPRPRRRAPKRCAARLFPHGHLAFQVPGHEGVNKRLLQLADEERGRDPVGIGHRSSVLGWHSKDKLHRRPEMQEFLAILYDNIAEVSRAYRIDTKQVSLELATCWIIVNGKFASSAVHCHPNAFLSGVYYIGAAENCGDIFFRIPGMPR
jgi:uncharacterized protein (TIGR02466 family)